MQRGPAVPCRQADGETYRVAEAKSRFSQMYCSTQALYDNSNEPAPSNGKVPNVPTFQ